MARTCGGFLKKSGTNDVPDRRPGQIRPGTGTYGYEDVLEADGRLPGIVVGFTRTRVRVDLTYQRLGRTQTLRKSVDAASLMQVEAALPRGTSV